MLNYPAKKQIGNITICFERSTRFITFTKQGILMPEVVDEMFAEAGESLPDFYARAEARAEELGAL